HRRVRRVQREVFHTGGKLFIRALLKCDGGTSGCGIKQQVGLLRAVPDETYGVFINRDAGCGHSIVATDKDIGGIVSPPALKQGPPIVPWTQKGARPSHPRSIFDNHGGRVGVEGHRLAEGSNNPQADEDNQDTTAYSQHLQSNGEAHTRGRPRSIPPPWHSS